MGVINQPLHGCLGDSLTDILENNSGDNFSSFNFIVAYVRKSGVECLGDSITAFRGNGGEIKAVVGIDQNTSYQGLQELIPLCDEIHVFHNNRIDHTFHPKLYFFEKEGVAKVFIGSCNFTEGGFYCNYETTMFREYDLTNDDDESEFQEIKAMFDEYSDESNSLCERLTPELLEQLRTRYLSDEDRETSGSRGGRGDTDTSDSLFGSENHRRSSRRRRSGRTTTSTAPTVVQQPQTQPQAIGNLVWRKNNLPASNVMDTSRLGANTSITGHVSLTKSGWSVGGQVIDNTTYFRYDVFGNLNWQPYVSTRRKEKAEALFDVTILGTNVGRYTLEIHHDPELESGQHNFTTSLHWGHELGAIIRSHQLTGHDLLLYAPPAGQNEPFFIEII